MRLLTLLLAGFTLAAATSAAGYDADQAFQQADRNGDGQLDPGEFHDRLVEVYYFADVDRNGRVSFEEMSAAAAIDEDWTRFDTDGNQHISLEEFVAGRMEDFRGADTNGNSQLTLPEVEAAAQGQRR